MALDDIVSGGAANRGSAAQVFAAFLKLGVTSFGGPIAHLGYFRHEFVARRKWLDEPSYADIVALCQFLPGPASSQVGITIGLLRAGLAGALAAWVGFTAPSALAMIAFGYGVTAFGNLGHAAWLHGLKIVAVAVVAQAVWGMAQSLCPDRPRVTLAIGAAVLTLLLPSAVGQVGVIALGALIGWRWLPGDAGKTANAIHVPLSRRAGFAAFATFVVLLILLPLANCARLSAILSWVTLMFLCALIAGTFVATLNPMLSSIKFHCYLLIKPRSSRGHPSPLNCYSSKPF